MAITRDFINPILKHAPLGMRPTRMWGAIVVAFFAALNPMSFFTKPYIGAVTWIILAWWFYNKNPFGLIRPRTEGKKTLIKGNPKWYQTTKSGFWSLLFTFIPLFFIYLTLLIFARLDAKTLTFV